MVRPTKQAVANAVSAQELHNAEMGQGAQHPQPGAPVVQGTPVEPAAGPVLLGVPRHGGLPNRTAWVVEDLTPAEEVVLNYRMAVSCFATIDIVTTLLNGLSLVHGLWWGASAVVLLIGPFCGLVGASSLSRCAVGVYLVFCALKVVYEIVMAILIGMVSSWAFFWIGFLAVVQFWIMKIVATFWGALGSISLERRKELAENKEAPAHMVYW